MPINLAKETIFNLTGTILPANGVIPTFKRASAAYVPFIESRGYSLRESNIHEPRLLNGGGLLLEPGTTNLINSPQQIEAPAWTIGSEVAVNRDTDLSMTNNYLTDKVSASGGGSLPSQLIYQQVTLKPGFYTLSAYISSLAGLVTSNDKLLVLSGGIAFDGSNNITNAELDGINLDTFWGNNQPFQNDIAKFKRVVLQFAVGTTSTIPNVGYEENYDTNTGFNPTVAAPSNYESTVTIVLRLGAQSTLGIAGFQLEAHPFPTSFIESTFGTPTRAAESLIYPQSPFAGVSSGTSASEWTCRFTLEDWEGDGVVFSAGNVRADIINNKLRVTCGGLVLNDISLLPQSAQVVIRNKPNHSLRLYVDFELRAQIVLNNNSFVATQGPLDFTPQAVRVIKDFIVFKSAIEDEIDQNPLVEGTNTPVNLLTTSLPIPGMLNCLFLLDYKVPVSEGKGRFVFTPITLRANEKSFIRFPMTRFFSTTIGADVTPVSVTARQRVTCNVIGEIGATGTTTTAVFTEFVIIDGLRFTASTDSSSTTNVTKRTALRDSLVTQISNAISSRQLTTISSITSSGSVDFILEATTAGIGFTVETSSGIGSLLTVASPIATGTITLSSAVSNEFRLGRAYILRNYKEVAAVEIVTKGNPATSVTVNCELPITFNNIKANDVLFQPSWETEIAPGNYFADTLEDVTGILVEAKAMDGFLLRNNSSRTISPITPLIKMFF
jgi:hypothetical protein